LFKAQELNFAEEVFGFRLPKILKRAYSEIGNGGFGPGPVIGLPGGYQSSWGDIMSAWEVFQRDGKWEEGWLPIIDWGCCQVSIIDCDNDFQMVTLYNGDFHDEDYSFSSVLRHWLKGEIPEFHTGGFCRSTRPWFGR
jgi:hypothetical protein